MPEPFTPDQLHQLRQRWEKDPKSRAFLQLAEEYRRAGRLSDAISVLQAGLREHPGYLSALVALGRCLLEAGDAEGAIRYLENAVVRDATQLVANKLLVEAFLARGDAAKARERLELYKLFNDRDAEIPVLERRIRDLSRPTEPVEVPVEEPSADSTRLFALPAVAELPDVELTPQPAQTSPSEQPFGELYEPAAAGFIEAALSAQGIFPLRPSATAIPVAAKQPLAAAGLLAEPEAPADRAPLPEVETAGAQSISNAAVDSTTLWPDLEAPSTPEIETHAEPAPSRAERLPSPEPELAVASPLPVEPPIAASATLGELYLAQGHLDEAEESFLAVLAARPEDGAARAGLESVRRLRGQESAAFDDTAVEVEPVGTPVGGRSARKAALLRSYLERFRRGANRHVS